MKALRLSAVLISIELLLAGSVAAQRPLDEGAFRGLQGPVAEGQKVITAPVTLDDETVVTLDVSPVRVFAEGAQIVVHGPAGDSLVPAPSGRWFAGTVVGDPDSVVVLAVGRSLRGFIATSGRVAVLGPERDPYGDAPSGRTVVRSFSAEFDAPDALRLFKCDTDALPLPPDASSESPRPSAPLSTTHYYAGIAIETDYELYAKFNSVAGLTQYVGDLFAAISYVYNRDVIVSMQVNYLSIWTTSSDPWTATNPSGALSEFISYWNANRTAVPRATAHMLSGRGLGGGVAYLNALCSGYGYGVTGSLSGVSPPNYTTTYWDFFAVSHELGHNFGSHHTHCYSPPVDHCYAQETGCYSGPTSVPPEKGTIMSYCHLLAGGYSNIKMFLGVTGEVSQVVKTTIRNYVESESSCFGTVPGPVVTGISPPAGSPSGGTFVTISGSNFLTGATVKLGGTAATGVSIVNASTITATTAAHPAGKVDVTVINPGNQGYTLAGGYSYIVAPTATVSGGGTTCAGGSVNIQAALTGTPPWSLTWSDGFTQSGVSTSPVTRSVSPGATTVFTLTAFSDAVGPGTTSGSATVTVNAVPILPWITAPPAVLPDATGVTASVPPHAGSTYLWGIINGVITSGGTTSQVTFTAGSSGTVALTATETNAAGCSSPVASRDVLIGTAGPAGLVEDAHSSAGTTSNVNLVLEPGETVLVNPSWQNISASPLPLTGTGSAFTGPAGATYSLLDASAGYGTIAPGATSDSFSAGGPSYRLFVSNPATRPVTHWDATFLETLSNGSSRTWTLHIGSSFPDVPTSHFSYRFVETLLHDGITAGCGGANYCPSSAVTRGQMAVFLSLSLLFPATVVPSYGTVTGVGSYNCTSGGNSLFTDVLPVSGTCKFIHDIYARGITAGCTGGKYCPGSNVTRGQMAVFLSVGMAGSGAAVPSSGTVPGVGSYNCTSGGNSLFADVLPTDNTCKFIHYIYANGVTAGCGGGDYCPDASVTRAEMAVFLVTAFDLPFLY